MNPNITHLLLLLLSSTVIVFAKARSSPDFIFPKEALPTASGYLPISSSSSSSLFYAFYEAQAPTSPLHHTPLLLWLQGGPGCSSLIGNFFELGPFLVSPHPPLSLLPNPSSWNRLFGLLFLDSPVGAGFSLASSPSDIPRDQPLLASHLFFALQSFLSSRPSLRSRPLFLTGESYAGKYVPSAGYHILQQNPKLPECERVNLAGVAIGNGLTHPVAQVATHADSAYFTGLVGGRQRKELEGLQDEAVRLTNRGNWSEASAARGRLLERLQNTTGLATLYDLRRKRPYESEMVGVLLNKAEVKELLGAKEMAWEECSEAVGKALHDDVMKSAKYMVEELVKRSRVLLYQGVFDLRDGVVSTEAWVKEMDWEGLEKFLDAERRVWKVGGKVAGHVQRWGSLTQVVVFGAGHLVPTDQGKSAQAMIEGWVLGNGLFADDAIGPKER